MYMKIDYIERQEDRRKIASPAFAKEYIRGLWYCQYMVHYHVFGDETGTGDSLPYILIGGAVASRPTWTILCQKWGRALSQSGISIFHATDCKSGRDGGFENLKMDQRIALFAKLAKLIARCEGLYEIIVAVDKDLAKKVIAEQKSSITPYHIAYVSFLCEVDQWGKQMINRGKEKPSLSVIVGNGAGLQIPNMRGFFLMLPEMNKLLFDNVHVVQLGIASTALIPLQITDHIAFGGRAVGSIAEFSMMDPWRAAYSEMYKKLNAAHSIHVPDDKLIQKIYSLLLLHDPKNLKKKPR
jgi:hypothetical protein